MQADLQARAIPRRGVHNNVRRTHSDLGGQRLFNWEMRNSYRRMFSTPSPLKMRPAGSPRRGTLETPYKRWLFKTITLKYDYQTRFCNESILYSASGAFKFILENYKPLEKPFCTSKPPLELVAFSHYILTQAGYFAHMVNLSWWFHNLTHRKQTILHLQCNNTVSCSSFNDTKITTVPIFITVT